MGIYTLNWDNMLCCLSEKAEESKQQTEMGSAKLVVALYRSLVRSAKVLDAHKEFKVRFATLRMTCCCTWCGCALQEQR